MYIEEQRTHITKPLLFLYSYTIRGFQSNLVVKGMRIHVTIFFLLLNKSVNHNILLSILLLHGSHDE
jgi:hypothetical protein